MKLLILVCCVAAAAHARPQTQPQVTDIAAAFDAYHQLWLAEARRNSMAPLSFNRQLSKAESQYSLRQPALQDVAQQQLTVSDTTVVQTQPAAVQEPVVEKLTVEDPAEVQLTVQEDPQDAVDATLQIKAGPTESAVQVQEQGSETVAAGHAAAADMQAAFNNFFQLWKAEAARNAMPPVFPHQSSTLTATPSAEATPPLSEQASPVETPVVQNKVVASVVQNKVVAPVVQEAVAPVVQKEAVAPVVQEAVAPVVQEAVAPVVQEAVAPVVREAVTPVAQKEAVAPVQKVQLDSTNNDHIASGSPATPVAPQQEPAVEEPQAVGSGVVSGGQWASALGWGGGQMPLIIILPQTHPAFTTFTQGPV